MANDFRSPPNPTPAQATPTDRLQAALQQGMALHRQGRLGEAKATYESILAQNPKHFDALNLLGTIAAQTRNHQAAVELIGLAIAINPNVASAYNNRGNALKDLKRLDEALASYDQALTLKPDYVEAHYNRANTLKDLNRPAEALASYDKAIALRPGYADAHYHRGNALMDLKRPGEALANYDQALALRPDHADAHNNRGNALLGLKRPAEALASYDQALALKPDSAETCYNRGNALLELRRLEEALASYDQAIALKPDYADAHSNRGVALKDLKRPEEALASYDKALALDPDNADAHNNRGNVLKVLERPEEAMASYDKALLLKPDYADAHSNRGNALMELKRPEEALASYDQALALAPDNANAYYNRGNALMGFKHLDAALASYNKALALDPDNADVYNNRGNTLMELNQLEAALASYDQAILLKPDVAEACYNRGNTLDRLRRLDEALSSYDEALALKPDYEFLLGTLLHTRMKTCDWRDFARAEKNLEAGIRAAKKITTPFAALALLDLPELHKQAAKIYAEAKYPGVAWTGGFKKRAKGEKIRIGYFSADFHNHATAYLMAELFEVHDGSKFELFGFSFGPNRQDEMRQRVSAAFDRFVDVRGKSDREVAHYARELGIDIAVDLKGYTQDSRPGIFAERCAPIQVNYLGYPGTMGVEYMDYILADTTVIPRERQSDYTEKVVYLPHSYQVNDGGRKISERVFAKREVGLPDSGFVFCCFNNNYKILPSTFDAWMRMLKAVEGSVLWLLEDNPIATMNLRREAASRGVPGSRLVFAERMPLDEHLARHRLADLFVDTFPYNAHTTASDALWAGLPVLTYAGRSFASRVAASLLNAIGLPELITNSPEEYEAKAFELATQPGKLAEIKLRLENNRLATPLFDTRLFAKNIESAYEAMYGRYSAGLAPECIEIV